MNITGGYIVIDMGPDANLVRSSGATPYDSLPAGTYKKFKYALDHKKPVVMTGGKYGTSGIQTGYIITSEIKPGNTANTLNISYVSTGNNRQYTISIADQFY